MPAVSVVMPTWNRAAFLRQAVDSVLAQTFTDFELIVVDSASDDETGAILDSIDDSRLRVVRLPFKCGEAIPRNVGMLAAEAPLIATMDSDDCMRPDRLKHQMAYMRDHPGVHILGSSFTLCDGRRRLLRVQPGDDAKIKAQLLYVNGNAIHNPTTMLRKAFLQSHQLSYQSLGTDGDHALWIECVRFGATFNNLPQRLLDYRYHGSGISRQDRGAMQQRKTRLRERLLGILMPSLSHSECSAIATLMENDRSLSEPELGAGVTAIDHVLSLRSCAHGADLTTIQKLLVAYRDRAVEASGLG